MVFYNDKLFIVVGTSACMVHQKEVRLRLKQLDKYLLKEYTEKYGTKIENNPNYDNNFHKRIKFAVKSLSRLIHEATKDLVKIKSVGCPQKLTLEQKVKLILIKQLMEKSNRLTSDILLLFSLMFNTEVSYKYIERLYSDDDVKLALCNLSMLIIKEKGIDVVDCCGDATGYSLTVTKHYCSYATKLKEESKVAKKGKKKQFVYKFTLMDLESKMYICYGSSLRSERDAYNKAILMLEKTEIRINSIRLDRYYSGPSTVRQFNNAVCYLIPKKNVSLKNGLRWNEMLTRFVKDTFGYLKEYFKRSNSESGFSADKKLFGWKINQKREDRIDTAIFCKVIWRNLFLLGA